ncbi:MAG: helix-turn-helix domain-containing protein [Prevotellaceae bacterium]|jgi:predicted DNA-binding transcriptional regulator AlpA|nr:helix-turn-helix domain-containing protein [Prevotellaceae bacterium]
MKQIDESTPVAALNLLQFSDLFLGLIAKAELNKEKEQPAKSQPERFGIDGAVETLCAHGLQTTKGSIYNHVSGKTIPHHRIGRRLIFDSNELIEWIKGKTTNGIDSDAALQIAASARRKK